MYNKNVSEKVQAVSAKIELAKDENEIFSAVTSLYILVGTSIKMTGII